MSLNWDFKKDFFGTMKIVSNKQKCKFNLYSGNATMIACYETEKTYRVWSFFASKSHMKNCLGLSKGCPDNIYDKYYIEFELINNKYSREFAKTVIKANFPKGIKIELKENVKKSYEKEIEDVYN